MSSRGSEVALRLVLIAVLGGAAVAEATWLRGPPHGRRSEHEAIYAAAIVAELALVVLYGLSRTLDVANTVVLWTFLRGAIANLSLLAIRGNVGRCHCLGARSLSQGVALAIQGGVVLLASGLGRLRGRRGPAGRGA